MSAGQILLPGGAAPAAPAAGYISVYVANDGTLHALNSAGVDTQIGTSATLLLPTSVLPVQTAEGSMVWDSDDEVLTVGTGAARKTMVDTDSVQTISNKTFASIKIGDVGTEGSGINVGGVIYESTFKVSDINGTNYAQSIFHRHSTTLEPLLLLARSNDNTSGHTAVTAGQRLATFYAAGSAGTNYKLFGSFTFAVDDTGTVSDTSAPGKFTLNLTPDGAVVPVAVMTVRNDKSALFAGAVTLGAGSTVDGTNLVGFRNIPQNSQSAAYTAVLADAGKHILHPTADATARIFTIPANSAVAYPIGTALTFVNQNGAGVVTIAITTDTMRLAGAGTAGSRTLAANGVATALKVTTTEWVISGAGLT